jgi:ribosomal-protein-alanine N-acetyltransferase
MIAVRAVESTDLHAFTAAARRSRQLHRPWTTAPCDAAAFDRYLARFDSRHNFGFVVSLTATGELVGAINLTNVVYGVFKSGYLGYFAFKGHEGRGYMKRGLSLVTRHAFRELGLHRLEANIQPSNVSSIALVRSCGFSKEGYSPAYLKLRGKWRDHERWALVRGLKSAAPTFDLEAAHKYFAADCFNKAWDLIEKPERTPEEDRLMVALNQASIFHWLNRADCTSENLSIGFWQASRIQALLGRADEARHQAETCLGYSHALEPFYMGYAYEALARAELMAGNSAKAQEHLRCAQRHAAGVENRDHQAMLLKDLDSLKLTR